MQLPWYLYWDGEKDNQGRLVGFEEWSKRLCEWAYRYREDDSEVGLEVLGGLTGEIWTATHDGGTACLAEKRGWRIVLQRVEGFPPQPRFPRIGRRSS